MYKFMIWFALSLAILGIFVLPNYGSNGDNRQSKSGLISVANRGGKLVDDTGLRHHIVSTNGMVIDTMTWCNGIPFSDVSEYVVAYDSMLNWFRPVANCSLYEVHGMFASGGKARIFACRYGYFSSDSSAPWPVTDNELPHKVLWTVSGSGAWEEKDFREYPSAQGFMLQFPGDSLFAVGFGSDSEARPHIFLDDYSQHTFIPSCEDNYPHWRFTYCHDGHWYFPYYYNPCQVPQPTWYWYPELNMRAVVNYYQGVPPFVESTQQKSNTWLRENIRIT